MMSLQATLKQGGSSTDMFGVELSDGKCDDWVRTISHLASSSCPWYDVFFAIRGAESSVWWAAGDWCQGFADRLRRTLARVDQEHQQCDLERDALEGIGSQCSSWNAGPTWSRNQSVALLCHFKSCWPVYLVPVQLVGLLNLSHRSRLSLCMPDTRIELYVH